jgi:hypothetical protein
VRIGKEGEGGRRGAGRWGQPVRGRERERERGGALGWGTGGEPGRRGCWAARRGEGRGEMGRGRRRAGPRGRKEAGRAGLAGLSSLFLLLSFFFSILKLFKQNYLNSNKFELKPYKLNTRKTMLQHECTNMLTL